MDRKFINFVMILMFIFSSKFIAGEPQNSCRAKYRIKQKIMANNQYRFIAVNQILMWCSNNGDGSHDPTTGGSGLYWPGGINATHTAVFEDGLIWGGKIDGEIRVGGSTYRQGLQAGKILDSGIPDDPRLDKYRVYKIRKDWESLPPGPERDDLERDYNEWPVEDGAPWVDIDGDGNWTHGVDEPEFLGDEVLWFVANDLDSSRTEFLYGSLPIGVELNVTIYAKTDEVFKDVVYRKYKIINKSNKVIEDMYLSMWTDPDLGYAGDDFSGCDTSLNMSYTYNGKSNDNMYGIPPAVGYILLQGPIVPSDPTDSALIFGEWRVGYKNLEMNTFAFYVNGSPVYSDPELGVYQGSIHMYNYMRGYVWNGNPYIDPNTNDSTRYPLSGDPVEGTGWYEGDGWPSGPIPGDRRQMISTGPFTMAPGDTQEVVYAVMLAQGNTALNSLELLKELAQTVREDYYGLPTKVVDENLTVSRYELLQNYPNPFNPSTIVKFSLPEENDVKLTIFNILGQEVASLVNRHLTPGNYKVVFDANNLPSGIYFYRIKAGKFSDVKKMLLMK